jgi:hypothetical protein
MLYTAEVLESSTGTMPDSARDGKQLCIEASMAAAVP